MLDLWRNDLYQKELEKVSVPEAVWGKLYGKKILITGATGMIGSFLVDLLRRKNEELSPADRFSLLLLVRDIAYAKKRFPGCAESGEVKLYKADLACMGQESELPAADYIFAGAGSADPKQFAENPVGTMKSNLFGAVCLLETARKNPGSRMVYISTGEVYGSGGTGTEEFKETDAFYVNPMEVRSCYPNSKRAAETFCSTYHKQYGIDVIVGRLCYIYGPTVKDTDSRSAAQFFRNAALGQDIVLKSRGGQIRSYCYVSDAVSALLHLMVYGSGGEAYNISDSGSSSSIREFAEAIAREAGVNCVYGTAEETEKAGYSKVPRAVQCPCKLNSIGWKASVSLADGIRKTIQILRG